MDLHDFCKMAFESLGCLVDSRDDCLEVLIPDEFKDEFKDRSYLKIVFRKDLLDSSDTEFICLGSPILSSLINLVSKRGRFSCFYLDLNPVTSNLYNKVQRKIRFLNCKSQFLEEMKTYSCYCIFNFKISYLSEDNIEEIRGLVIDLNHLGLRQRFLNSDYTLYLRDKFDPSFLSLIELGNIRKAYEKAKDCLIKEYTPTILNISKGLEKRLRKGMERVNGYYLENEEEINKRIERERIEEKRERLYQKLQLNRLEKDRKLRELEDKYKIKVKIRLLNLALVFQPKIKAKIELILKDKVRYFNIFWDPLFKEVESAFCQGCREETEDLYFDLKSEKALCKGCYNNRRQRAESREQKTDL